MKPIVFDPWMIDSIRKGFKTQTRRPVKGVENLDVFRVEPAEDAYDTHGEWDFFYEENVDKDMVKFSIQGVKAPCSIGDVLYVMEPWYKDVSRYMYRADYHEKEHFYQGGKEIQMHWGSAIHMPKEAARIFLKVKEVRPERLQSIDADDLRAEGFASMTVFFGDMDIALLEWKTHWDDKLKGKEVQSFGWDANPWVWRIEFERCEKSEIT